MPDEMNVCPKCGAVMSREIGVLLRYECGSGNDKGTLYQSNACTITALQQQLADAKARVAHLEWCCAKLNNTICQTLGKALGYPRFGELPEVCDDPNDGSICVFEHVAETLADEAARQLADARLLAKCYRNAAGAGYLWIPSKADFDPDGLPILTPELRAALIKATGDS